jgi:hypothetical protein
MPEEAKERSVDGPDVLACGENDVSLTQRRAVSRRRADFDNTGFVLHSARCTKEKCRVSTVHVDEMLAASSSEDRPDGIGDKDVVAGVLDGRLLVVWRSSHHGVRFRLSAPDALSRAKDGVLYDDRVQNGQVFAMSLIQPNFRLVIRRNAALVLLETMDSSNQGTKAIRILPDGSTSVVHVIR